MSAETTQVDPAEPIMLGAEEPEPVGLGDDPSPERTGPRGPA